MKKTCVFLLFALCALMIFSSGAWAEEDFAGKVTLNTLADTKKVEATVKTFVDGDTVHFFVPTDVSEDGVLKARFLAINTPETTGKVEEYGKKASALTREKLENAVSIILESDDGNWNIDSTGSRYLVWVWYKTNEGDSYRNLNIEILQNGLAKSSSTGNNRYGAVASQALDYAKESKLNIYSGQKDPDFYYGDAIELTIKELRRDLAAYDGKKVAFNGIVSYNDGNSVFVEDFDEETGLYFGMPVYYGYNLSGQAMAIIKPGNEVRIVGTMQYYEGGDTYQVSDLTYKTMRPKDPGNIQKLSAGHTAAFAKVDAKTFASGMVDIEGTSYPYAQLTLATTVEIADITVIEACASQEEQGTMTLTCKAGDHQVQVRVNGMKDASGAFVTADTFMNKTLTVKGVVDRFDGQYQVKVLSFDAITFMN